MADRTAGAAVLDPDEHHHQASVVVADLGAVAARRGSDRFVSDLIRHLNAQSHEFAALWAWQDVAIRRSDRKRPVHPTLGEIELNCLSLLSEDGTRRLLWFTPLPGTAAMK